MKTTSSPSESAVSKGAYLRFTEAMRLARFAATAG
jgi:hypothetical protein